MGQVRNTVLRSYPSLRDRIKRNKSKYGAKLKIEDYTVAILGFVVDALLLCIQNNFKINETEDTYF